MTTMSTPALFAGPLDARDAAAIAAFRRVLDAHGFASAVPTAHGRARLPGPAPLDTLIKLFVFDEWVDESALRCALAPLDVRDVRELGLIDESSARGVRARVRLSAYRGLVLARDRHGEQLRTRQADYEVDVNASSVTLANLTVRRKVRSALDVGTGCGILALLAARHADHVVGTDPDEHALNLAAFNARLNGVDHVEWRLGSLFEPVAGSRFDLITCNPSERKDGALCQEITGQLPRYLEDGGFASLLCHGVVASDDEWFAPLRRWVAESGCAAWLLCLVSLGLGAIVLRRRSGGKTWVRADRLPGGATDSCSTHIQRVFHAEDVLSSIRADAALLGRAFLVAEDHCIVQTLAPTRDGYAVTNAEIELTGGFRTRRTVDAFTTRLLAGCDGRRTLDEIVSEIAPDAGPARDQLAVAAVAMIKRLLATGFLISG